MKPEDFSKDQFVLKIRLNTDLEKAFNLVASSEGLTSWFLGKVDFFDKEHHIIANGDTLLPDYTYSWTWEKGYQIKGKVLKYVPKKEFSFTFGTDFSVTITLREIKKGKQTEVLLTQFNHQPSEENEFGFMNCCVCWTFFLTNLKSVAETQKDLRERNSIDESFINQ